MGGLRLISTFGWLLEILALAAFATAFVALSHNETHAVVVFITTGAVMVFIATTLILGFRGQTAPSRRRHGLALLLLSWVVLPIFATIPFVAISKISLISGYYEAVSVLTTTGSSAFLSLDDLPRSLIFWRAILEWLGGALTIVTAAVAVDIASNNRHGGVHILTPQIADISRLAAVAIRILPIYIVLTIACAFLLSISTVPSFDAICLAMATLSTGGAVPQDGDLSSYGSVAMIPILGVFMIFGALNLVLLNRLSWRSVISYLKSPVILLRIYVLAGVSIVIFFVFNQHTSALESKVGSIVLESVFAAISLLSTTAFIHDADIAMGLPIALVICLVMFGGMYGSTAGGLKIDRVVRMFYATKSELDILVHPSVVGPASSSRIIDEPQGILWSYLIAFLLGIVVVSIALSGAGLDFELSLFVATGSITNAGPIVEYLGLGSDARIVFSSLPESMRGLLAFAMIAGRIEILALLALLTPLFWSS